MSIWHLSILAIVVLLVFGTGKLAKLGPDLGTAIRGFKKSLSGDDEGETHRGADVMRADAAAESGRSDQAESTDRPSN